MNNSGEEISLSPAEVRFGFRDAGEAGARLEGASGASDSAVVHIYPLIMHVYVPYLRLCT